MLILLAALALTGCGQLHTKEKQTVCHVVLEDNDKLTVQDAVQTVTRGDAVTFHIAPEEGYYVSSVSSPDAEIVTGGSDVTVTLPHVLYSETVTAQVEQYAYSIHYVASNKFTKYIPDTHLRVNTARATEVEARAGYTLVGWNTEPDGTGTYVGLGSRIEMQGSELTLYGMWEEWTDPAAFTYEVAGDNAIITGYDPAKEVETLVIPGTIDGKTVTSIASRAICDDRIQTLILPASLQSVKSEGIVSSSLSELYLFDSIRTIDDYSFLLCPNLQTLHIAAAEDPVYTTSYFGTFQDKLDRLISLKDQPKIVLFSGSSTRFGYDSEAIEEAFPGYRVVNMGVFAYTNALPQVRLIKRYMREGDILLLSPELDAAKRQFFTTNDLDDEFFCMMEENYDAVAALDLREYRKVFSSLHTYLAAKEGMDAADYALSPSDYDEDGQKLSGVKSYNRYGDYCLYRENAASDAPIYNLPVEYTAAAYPKELYLDPANRVLQELLDDGIRVYMTYSPRNRQAISEDSTPKMREELDRYFRENLIVPIISPLEESLYPGRYLYGTDNHLSTEGVAIRTGRVIRDLKQQMEKEGSQSKGMR